LKMLSHHESTASPSSHHVIIAIRGPIWRWIEPWYGAYAILGALASGFAVLLIPLIVARVGGSATAIGVAVAAQNIGAVSAPIWGELADRTRAYRAIFFNGFLVMGLGFVGFSLLSGLGGLVGSAYLIGLGTGASNTVATLFVVEFTPNSEWSQRISWMQTFNACGSVLGMAAAGLLVPRAGMLVAAFLALPAIAIGAKGLPVPGGPLHFPHLLTGEELVTLVCRGGPGAAALHMHRWRPKHLFRLAAGDAASPFGLFLFGWFAFSLAVSAFVSLYPVLMLKSFDVPIGTAATLMSVATAASIPLYNPAGRLAARYGAPIVLGIGYLGRLVAMAGMTALAYFRPDFRFLGVLVLFALFQGIWPPLGVASNDLAASLAPFGEGAAMGLFNAAAAIASAFGAVAGGAIADHFGYSAVPLFSALALTAALATVRPQVPGPTASKNKQSHGPLSD
jgi:MFS family permease